MDDDADESVVRPRTIDTSEYVKARVRQIAELLEVVDNPALCPGEVTSGPRTVFQRLPRHMRRRAMSHNVKRLPRLIRPLAIKSITRTEHRKKAPSRLWRRRPSRMLKVKVREQKKAVWLSTHIWHAKRFHMQSCWGFKLPIRSCNKSFRPNYRSSLNSAVIIDQSYLSCLQFNSPNDCEVDYSAIAAALSAFCQKSVSQTFSNLSTENEISVMLYKPDKFPCGLIGPAKVCSSANKLFLWIHPSTEAEFLKELVKTGNFQIGTSFQPSAKGMDKIVPGNESEDPAKIQVFPLRNRFARFHLVGPNALASLHYVLKLVSNHELDALGHSEFEAIHNWWSKFAANVLPGNLRPGTQIPLLVEDPRLFRAQTRTGIPTNVQRPSSVCRQVQPPPITSNNLMWDWQEFQEHFLPRRFSHADFERFCSGRLAFPQRTDFKVPVMVVIDSSNHPDRTNPISTNRICFICPAAVSYDFWLAFQFANIRAIGLHDKKALDFEGGLMTFPDDCPDSAVGRKHNQSELETLLQKHNRRPKNKKIGSGRNGNSPFTFEWKNLFRRTAQIQDFSIIRNKLLLRNLQMGLKDGNGLFGEGEYCSNCQLVPISLKILCKGIPKRLATIHMPTIDDLKQIEQNPKNVIRRDNSQLQTNPNGTAMDTEERWDESKNEIYEFLPLSGDADFGAYAGSATSISKLVAPNDLFGCKDKNQMKRERNRRKRQRKRESKKSSPKAQPASSVAGLSPPMGLAAAKTTSPSHSIQGELNERRIVGAIVRGDYSLIDARGAALGYVTLESLEMIGPKKMVLLRNATNQFYFPAKISIHRSEISL